MDSAKSSPVGGSLCDGLGKGAVAVGGYCVGRRGGRGAVPAAPDLLRLEIGGTARCGVVA